ncbi:hypothetical protein CJ030_MR2G019272 [Morella rubra]|uniref:RRM domain-containing protein n=1 Tax=Morella rubra TaxID=262757 RepID=A0A6A1WGC3_9ROSI|nr:hypothetical protein CJ030_MR2G019272 [Morella rubra]
MTLTPKFGRLLSICFSNSPNTSHKGHGNFDGRNVNDAAAANLNNPPMPSVPQNATLCPTLFVVNLGPTCTEEELIQVFSRCPGFLKLKMQNTWGSSCLC